MSVVTPLAAPGPVSDLNPAKVATRAQWDSAAAGWDAQTPQIRAWLAGATAAMLGAARIGSRMRVLDVAAGAGDQTLDVARRVGIGGSVLATDLSPAILTLAERNAHAAGLSNVTTRVGDGEELNPDDGSFDAAVCRLGLMLFPAPARALSAVHRVLHPGGRFAALVFSEPRVNPALGIVMSTAFRHAGVPPRDPFAPGALFSLGRPGALEAMFTEAGFTEVVATRVDAPFRLSSAADYVAFVRTSAPPILGLLARLDEAARAAAWADIEAGLAVFTTPTGWEGPNELLLVSGTRR
jgi:SAM-dependent methyltransferase